MASPALPVLSLFATSRVTGTQRKYHKIEIYMADGAVSDHSSRAKRLAVIAIVLLAGAISTVVGVAAGRSGTETPTRAFSLEQKGQIEAELEAVVAARRKFAWREMWAHGRRALDLAEAYGQDRLAFNIRRSMRSGCFAGGAEYHAMLALRLLDESPTAAR